MTYSFLHTSDLHLGRAYGGFPEEIRGRLREARHTVISRLATAARGAGASDVLLAGDTFDAETPSPETLRHALRAMAAEGDLRWFVMPGNHDSLAASELWRRILTDAPPNLVVLADPVPFELASDAWLLPAPCTQRRPGRDVTEAMSTPTPEGAIRIGLGHGAIMDFSSDEGSPGIIPPDRARLSGLDYLGLGDWHGRMQIGPATWYSGTPEADGFKHDTAPGALAVQIAANGAPVQVSMVPTGQFHWLRPALDLLPGEDFAARLTDQLPPEAERRDTLMRLEAAGRLTLAERAGFEAELANIAPDFGWFDSDLARLTTEVTARASRYEREVRSLARLRSALEEARRAAREAYFGPVLSEIDPLLSILHPGAALRIDDASLLPTVLTRDGQDEALDILSGGTREQLAILTRLAFARLFARSGRAVPVILDDALVHSDDDRIEVMFTALHRVAQDQQIIVMTCRQRAFASLGGERLHARVEWV